MWEQRSLLDLPESGLGPFDYIDCCGVLHHLPDPAAGLRALLSVLAPGGGMGLMVYAPYGRTGVYMMQDALRRLAPPEDPPQQRLDIARRVMKHLPETQWLRHNRNFDDHINGGDAGLYDLLLNPRDRAYTVPALHCSAAGSGPATSPAGSNRCATTLCRCCPIRSCARASIGWTRRSGPRWPRRWPATWRCTSSTASAPAPRCSAPTRTMRMRCRCCGRSPARPWRARVRPDGTMPVTIDGLRIPVALPPLATAILPLIDGTSSVGQIGTMLAARGIKPDAFMKAWHQTFAALERINRLLLAAPP